MRKKVSCTEIGLPAWLVLDPWVPTVSSALELVVPASNSRPSILTPSTSATCMVFTPFCGMRVGKPTPSTTGNNRNTRNSLTTSAILPAVFETE